MTTGCFCRGFFLKFCNQGRGKRGWVRGEELLLQFPGNFRNFRQFLQFWANSAFFFAIFFLQFCAIFPVWAHPAPPSYTPPTPAQTNPSHHYSAFMALPQVGAFFWGCLTKVSQNILLGTCFIRKCHHPVTSNTD